MIRTLFAFALPLLLSLGLLSGCSAVDKEGAVPFSPPLLQSADPANVNEIQSVQLPFTDTAAFPIDNFAGYAFSSGGGTIVIELGTGSGARQAFALYGPRAANGVWGNAILQRDGREATLAASLDVDAGRYLLLVGTVSGTESGQYTVSATCTGDGCEPLQNTCAELDCINECPLGYITDSEGCQTCQCVTECTSEFDCPGDEVCNADGECVAGCQCNQPLNPVCGADGQTYGNECEASCAGVEVVAFQACAEDCPALPCDLQCPDGLATDSQGCPVCECRSQCDNCSSRFEPVCTANGKTYINRCEAECAGEAVNYLGQCRTECANLDCDLSCPDGLALDADGCPECACGPEALSCESSPDGTEVAVCAANGATYPSSCDADAAGVGVVYDEFCPGYSCRTDTSCPLGTTCLKPEGGANCLMNSAGECLGVCVRQQSCDPMNGMFAGCPEGYLCIDGTCESSCSCSSVYDPVCGNDNITYDNACVASCAGARIVKAGRCCQPLDGCMLDCPNGYQLDGNQCATCQCRAEPPCACTDLDSPVCVTTADGQALTYQNECWAQCDGYSDIADGSCP